MKRLILSVAFILLLTLTGCVQKLKTTEEQTDALAEYMAGLLLKYDPDYTSTLKPQREIQKDNEENIGNHTEKQTNDKYDVKKDNTDASIPSGTKSEPDEKADEADKQPYTLAELLGLKDFDIGYSGYKVTESYPEDFSKAYFSIVADKGNQLMVIKFNIKNLTKEKKSLELDETEISYQLDVAGSIIEKPLFTVLENDLQYIDVTIDGDAAVEAVLVYQISKGTDTGNTKLIVSNGDKKLLIPVK